MFCFWTIDNWAFQFFSVKLSISFLPSYSFLFCQAKYFFKGGPRPPRPPRPRTPMACKVLAKCLLSACFYENPQYTRTGSKCLFQFLGRLTACVPYGLQPLELSNEISRTSSSTVPWVFLFWFGVSRWYMSLILNVRKQLLYSIQMRRIMTIIVYSGGKNIFLQ